MVAIVDYRMGNLHSVRKACTLVGIRSRLVTTAAGIRNARGVILPGVGAFGQAMRHLARQGLIRALKESIAAGKPFLGICLGMQLLFEGSEEFGRYKGLGIFPGRVRLFPRTCKVPHMGWNHLQFRSPHPILRNIPEGTAMYFVHSFYCDPADKSIILATSQYGVEFAAAIGRGNVCATQFHPEKSQSQGLKVYRNLARLLAPTR